jgi:hypothetical protein
MPWLGSIQLSAAGNSEQLGSSLAAVAVDNLRELSPAVGGRTAFSFERRSVPVVAGDQGKEPCVGLELPL